MTKMNNTFISNTKDLYIFLLMYNLLEYSDNFSIISATLCNYYIDEVNHSANEIDDNDSMINNNNKKQLNLLSIRKKW